MDGKHTDTADAAPVEDGPGAGAPPEQTEHPSEQGRRFAANIAHMATSQVITWSLALLWTVLVPRLLGPQDLGLLVIATSVTTVVAVVAGLPPKDYVVRQVVAKPEEASSLVVTSLLMRAAMLPVMLAFAAGYVWVTGLDSKGLTVMLIVAGATFCTMLLEPLLATFQAKERMKYIAINDVTNKTLGTAGSVLLVLAGFGVVAVAGWIFLTAAVVLLLAGFWINRLVGLRARPMRLRPIIRRSAPYWVVQVSFVSYLWADSMLLGALATPEVVGWYGAATRLFTTMMVVAVILSTVSLPRLIKAHAEGPQRLAAVARGPFEWVMILGLPIGAGLACVAHSLVPLLFGQDYLPAAPTLAILGATLPLMYLNIMLNQLFIAEGKPSMMAWLLGASAVVNIGLNLVLIPLTQQQWGNGAIGAAIGMFVAELFQVVLGFVLVGRRLMTGPTTMRISRAAAATAAMVAVLLLLRDTVLPVQIGVGVVVFTAAAMVLRVVSPQERATALSAVRGALQRRRSRE